MKKIDLNLAAFAGLLPQLEDHGFDRHVPTKLLQLQALTLSKMNPAGGPSLKGKSACLWGYRTADLTTVIDTAGYFNDASNLLAIGDLIYAVTVDDADNPTSVTTAGLFVVLSNAAGVVDVSNATAMTLTDTD